MVTKIIYYDRINAFTTNSTKIKEECIEGAEDEIFLEFFKRNNSLKYCNFSYWKFEDKILEDKYRKTFKKYCTINNYCGNGVVD